MGSDVAPELIFDQGLGLYYPTATDYYGYYYTEPEPPFEWDKYHQFFSLDGQDLHATNEGFSDVYYIPNYGYVQSPYNPYNPSIPGAPIGSEASSAAHYQANPAQQFVVSSPAYIPVVNDSSSVAVPIRYQTPLWTSTCTLPTTKPRVEGKRLPLPLVPMNQVASKPLQSSSGLSQTVPKLEERSNGKNMPNIQHPVGALTSGGIPTTNRGINHVSNLKIPSVFHLPKADAPTSNGFTTYGSNLKLCCEGDKLRTRFQMNRALTNMSGSLAQQNKGPRTDIMNCQWASPLAIKPYSLKSGSIVGHGNITISLDEYNRDDFQTEYEAAKFFVIKSYSEDDVHKSIKYNVWSSTPSGNKRLDNAFDEAKKSTAGKETCPVFLFFSVNVSGHFCGVAEMIGPVDFQKDMDFWQQDKWLGSFPIKWHIIKDVANARLRHILLENNEYRPVTCSRDTQEIPNLQGNAMLRIFKNAPASTSVLDDFVHYEEREIILIEGKSKIPGRRCNADFIPVTLVSSEKILTVEEEKIVKAEEHNTEGEEPVGGSYGVGAHKLCDEVGCSVSDDQNTASFPCSPTKAVESLCKPFELIILGRTVEKLNSPFPVDCEAGEGQSVVSKNDVITIGSMRIKVGKQASCPGVLAVGSFHIDRNGRL